MSFTLTGFHRSTLETRSFIDATSPDWLTAAYNSGAGAEGSDFQFTAAFVGEHYPDGTIENMPRAEREVRRHRERSPILPFTVVGFSEPAQDALIHYPVMAGDWVAAGWQVINSAVLASQLDTGYRFVAVYRNHLPLAGTWSGFARAYGQLHAQQGGQRKAAF